MERDGRVSLTWGDRHMERKIDGIASALPVEVVVLYGMDSV